MGAWLVDFAGDPASARAWSSQDDRVMGGESHSRLTSAPGMAVFEGVVSFGRGGGFASVRSAPFRPPLDLSDAGGLVIRGTGDGGRYKLALRNEESSAAPVFMAAFELAGDRPDEVVLPRERFAATWRGRPVRATLDWSAVTSLGLYCSRFEPEGSENRALRPGPFRLELTGIGRWTPPGRPAPG